MRIIVTSRKNIASSNIHSLLVKEFGFEETGESFENCEVYKKQNYLLISSSKGVLELEYLKEHFSPEVWLVASSHSSEAKVKTLCCHPTGNWGEARFGGKSRELCTSPALFLRAALLKLLEASPKNYRVSYEATHHSPSEMNAPLCFVEVGSTPLEWNDLEACRAVCNALLVEPEEKVVAVAFGGTHYAPNFSKPSVVKEFAISHICPKWHIENLDEEIIKQAFEKSVPGAELALIDWKGMNSSQRQKLLKLLENLSIPWKKI